jgi:hypothetical protein
MTTNKQLREWLARFPDDTLIEVITTDESPGYRGYYLSDTHEQLILPDVDMSTLTSWDDFANVVFDIKYDYDSGCVTDVHAITLGKAHND